MEFEIQVSFGQWLKQQRKFLGLTQAELAKALNCSTINIRKIEADERKPSKQVANLLADILSIPNRDRDLFVSFSRRVLGPDQVETAAAKFALGGSPSGSPILKNFKLPQFPDPLPPLPAPRTSFIGRQQEQSRLQHLLIEQDTRLVTLTGAPGVGKTRLALEVSAKLQDKFPGGVCLIPLAPIRNPNEVGWAIVQGLGGTGGSDYNHLDNLITILRYRSCLLIVDNFEHVLDAAPLVAELLKACPQLKVLATSREPLHIYGEHELHVPPLALPNFRSVAFSSGDSTPALQKFPSIQLFTQRCQAILPDFQITLENAKAIADICFRLDGLPLAIELAAARIKTYSPESIFFQLNNRFHFLSKGMRDFDNRHKTLNAAIDWSYQLLTPQEKRMFDRLSIFNDFFTLDDARAVCSLSVTSPLQPLAASQLDEDVLLSLVEKSLCQISADAKKFILLETIREFALARLKESGEYINLKTAHAHYFLSKAIQAQFHMHQPEAASWLDLLDNNYINIRAALSYAFDHGPLQAGLQAASSLLFYWFRRNTFEEGYLWLNTAVTHLDACENLKLRSEVLTSFGALGFFLRVGAPFEERLHKALALWRTQGDLHGEAKTLFWLSLVSRESQYFYLDESIALFRQVDDPWWLAFSLWLLAAETLSIGGRSVALASLQESERLFLQLEDRYGLSYIHATYARAEMFSGNVSIARTHLQKALELKKSFGDKWGTAQVIKDLGEVEYLLAAQPEDYQLARALLEESIDRFHELNAQHGEILYAMHRLGNVLTSLGSQLQALKTFRETLLLGQKYQMGAESMAMYLVGPAELALACGKTILSVQLISAIYSYDPDYPKPMDCAGKVIMENLLSALQTRISPLDYELAWQIGKQLSIDEAITLVLEMG